MELLHFRGVGLRVEAKSVRQSFSTLINGNNVCKKNGLLEGNKPTTNVAGIIAFVVDESNNYVRNINSPNKSKIASIVGVSPPSLTKVYDIVLKKFANEKWKEKQEKSKKKKKSN